jgi:hypothetical protein
VRSCNAHRSCRFLLLNRTPPPSSSAMNSVDWLLKHVRPYHADYLAGSWFTFLRLGEVEAAKRGERGDGGQASGIRWQCRGGGVSERWRNALRTTARCKLPALGLGRAIAVLAHRRGAAARPGCGQRGAFRKLANGAARIHQGRKAGPRGSCAKHREGCYFTQPSKPAPITMSPIGAHKGH